MRIVVFLFILVVCSCHPAKEENPALKQVSDPASKKAAWWKLVHENKKLVRDGDLVTRAGGDMISNSLRNFSKQDKSYSHSGIALVEDGQVYVYHTLTGEENTTDKMMREPFDSFCNPERKIGFGIFRYAINDEERARFDSLLRYYYRTEMRFDRNFDLKNDSTMYCAEIIYKCLKKSTNNRVILPTTVVKNFKVKDPGYKGKVMKEFEYVALDNLYKNPNCTQVTRVQFQ
jgi:hypothetical protein